MKTKSGREVVGYVVGRNAVAKGFAGICWEYLQGDLSWLPSKERRLEWRVGGSLLGGAPSPAGASVTSTIEQCRAWALATKLGHGGRLIRLTRKRSDSTSRSGADWDTLAGICREAVMQAPSGGKFLAAAKSVVAALPGEGYYRKLWENEMRALDIARADQKRAEEAKAAISEQCRGLEQQRDESRAEVERLGVSLLANRAHIDRCEDAIRSAQEALRAVT